MLIKINGKFVPLTGLEQIPSGSQVDARHGSLELITSTGQQGKTQHGTFGGAIFRLTQERSGPNKGLATLTLLEGAFKGAPSYAICKKHKAGDASAAAVSSKVLQLLHASAHGKFRTSGRYSAATVRGTIWTVADRCDGTLTHDVTDSVAVKDFVHHKTIILHAGQSYLAKNRRPDSDVRRAVVAVAMAALLAFAAPGAGGARSPWERLRTRPAPARVLRPARAPCASCSTRRTLCPPTARRTRSSSPPGHTRSRTASF